MNSQFTMKEGPVRRDEQRSPATSLGAEAVGAWASRGTWSTVLVGSGTSRTRPVKLARLNSPREAAQYNKAATEPPPVPV